MKTRERSGGGVEGVLPSGDIAAQSGITAAALGVGTSKYDAVAMLYKLFNFAQGHREMGNPGFGSSPARGLRSIDKNRNRGRCLPQLLDCLKRRRLDGVGNYSEMKAAGVSQAAVSIDQHSQDV